MGLSDNGDIRPFRGRIRRFKPVGGGVDSSGRVVGKPWELEEAQMVDGLCQRYGCLPSQLLDEDVQILKMLAIVAEGRPEDNAESD